MRASGRGNLIYHRYDGHYGLIARQTNQHAGLMPTRPPAGG